MRHAGDNAHALEHRRLDQRAVAAIGRVECEHAARPAHAQVLEHGALQRLLWPIVARHADLRHGALANAI
jgi:hypothetical protein